MYLEASNLKVAASPRVYVPFADRIGSHRAVFFRLGPARGSREELANRIGSHQQIGS